MSESIDEELVSEAVRIVEFANSRDVTLRILGSVAIWLHSQEHRSLFSKLERLGAGRRLFTDIDLMGYRKERMKIRNVLEKELGVQVDQQALLYYGDKRLIGWGNPNQPYQIDVFMDRLEYSHAIDFGKNPQDGRLKLDFPTIDLADLLLEKLQIHDINEKDIKDLIVLLVAHEVADKNQNDTIDGIHVANVLAQDWGFWYDARSNLDKVRKFGRAYSAEGKIPVDESIVLEQKVDDINRLVDQAEKSKEWQKRANKGTAETWWKPVEERTR